MLCTALSALADSTTYTGEATKLASDVAQITSYT
jgi:hypothetical protein